MAAPGVFSVPEAAVIRELERERLPVLQQEYAGAELCPIEEEDADTVLWEIPGNVTGLSLARGANEEFPVVQDVALNRYFLTPGRFGESMIVDEVRMERMRKPGTLGDPLDATSEIGRLQEALAEREGSLIEKLRWDMLVTGSVNVLRKDGTSVNVMNYVPQRFTPSIPFTTYATATPLANFRTIRSQFSGFGHIFDGRARAYGQAKTIDTIFANTNQNDIAGKRLTGLSQALSIKMYNQVALDEGLPLLEYYDGTYLSESTKLPVRYIPEGKLVVVGYRKTTGLKVGAYKMTRNASNPNQAPGIYVNVGVRDRAPLLPFTERGHNGAPVQNYIRQVVVVNAYTP